MPELKTSAGDPLPPHCRPIEVHVAKLKQLFNAIDPSPFRERDLDPNAHDWWPIRQEAQLYDRLSAMPVRIVYKDDTKPDAWRSDWPAVAPAVRAGAAQ